MTRVTRPGAQPPGIPFSSLGDASDLKEQPAKVTFDVMPTYQVTYFKRGLRADDPFASELRTECVKAERIVNEGPFVKFYANGLVLSVRDKDLKVVKELGVPPVESA
jgi:hypothetical protein